MGTERKSWLKKDLDALAQRVPKYQRVLAQDGYPDFRNINPDFSSLLRIMVGQQISVKAAHSIWQRIKQELNGDVTAQSVAEFSLHNEKLPGLSARKQQYAIALSEDFLKGNFENINEKSDQEIIDTIIAVKGFGMWSAQIYLLLALDRRDVILTGDLGVRQGCKLLLGMQETPSEQQLSDIVEDWSPRRGAANFMFWQSLRHPF